MSTVHLQRIYPPPRSLNCFSHYAKGIYILVPLSGRGRGTKRGTRTYRKAQRLPDQGRCQSHPGLNQRCGRVYTVLRRPSPWSHLPCKPWWMLPIRTASFPNKMRYKTSSTECWNYLKFHHLLPFQQWLPSHEIRKKGVV